MREGDAAHGGGGKSAASAGGGAPAQDPRFAAMLTDPRFQRFPKHRRTVAIDERFKGASWGHAAAHVWGAQYLNQAGAGA
jgi:hypothetical protein